VWYAHVLRPLRQMWASTLNPDQRHFLFPQHSV